MACIVFINKYPPLEGGIAAKTFWLVRSLARAGHTLHIVTDPLSVDPVHSVPEADHIPESLEVFVHRADQDVPWHIPNDNHRAISLLDKALEIVSQNKPHLIVGGYLIPYGIVAFQVSQVTGIPYVLLHGGSDINKFLSQGIWHHILNKVIAKASLVITDVDNQDHIERYTNKIGVLPPYAPDPSVFTWKPRINTNIFTLALIGKANYHWHHKGWQQVIDLWSLLGEECRFTVVSQGTGLDDFKHFVPEALQKRIIWLPFVPPWKMPNLLQNIDGVFHLNNHLPFPMFSNLVLESLSCGTTVITDSVNLPNHYRKHGIYIEKAAEIICPISFDHSQNAAIILKNHFLRKNYTSWDCSLAHGHYITSIVQRLLDVIEIESAGGAN